MNLDLFAAPVERLSAGAVLLRGFVPPAWQADAPATLAALVAQAPICRLQTPGGRAMSVTTSSCGTRGWHSDARGYRYINAQAGSGTPWPLMPPPWRELAQRAAAEAGFAGFEPDVCLINRYAPGARMSLHQDRDERDFGAPIVSVSLGLPAVFLWGGLRRSDAVARLRLHDGDVLVWGGPDRLRFHGVQPVAVGSHAHWGACRINLTFRKAG